MVALAGLAVVTLVMPAGAVGAKRIALGVYSPGLERNAGGIGRYARLMGRPPAIVSYYKQWDFPPFVPAELNAIRRRGAVPMITWEPLSYQGRHYPLRAIVRGRFDPYLQRAARTAAAWPHPMFVRFAHEMNGHWYPWGAGVRGNTPRRFKLAWRHVVRIFRRAGASNVKWVWTPNANQFGRLPFRRFYPGDRWVDWVGLDGFNWGYGGSSYSFRQIFGHSYRVLTKLSSRPVMIAETGTCARGKARWISQALRRQLPRMRRVGALIWFNSRVNGVDMRFNRGRAALRAFRRGARGRRYRAGGGVLLGAPPGRTRLP